MRVKNIKGTSNNTCICGSWLTHWEFFLIFHSHLGNCCSEKSCKIDQKLGHMSKRLTLVMIIGILYHYATAIIELTIILS